jgi:predicted RNA-binding protein (virulence factor B family)
VPLSPWQIKPTEAELNEAVTFALENLDKKEKITAKLYNNKYIPEFYTAVKFNKANAPVDAAVYKVTPHGIYLNLVADKIQVKLPFKEGVKVNDVISVKIVYLSPFKIIAEEVISK